MRPCFIILATLAIAALILPGNIVNGQGSYEWVQVYDGSWIVDTSDTVNYVAVNIPFTYCSGVRGQYEVGELTADSTNDGVGIQHLNAGDSYDWYMGAPSYTGISMDPINDPYDVGPLGYIPLSPDNYQYQVISWGGSVTIEFTEVWLYCPIPTPTPTVTETPVVTDTPEPTATETPVVTNTPEPTATQPPTNITVLSFTGGDVNLDRTISYGDIAVVVALLGVIGCMIVYMFIRVPRLWKR